MEMEKNERQGKLLSIIIVTYNSEKDIYDCIDSIFKYNDLPNDALEVIVVDNNSKMCDSMFGKIRQLYGGKVECIKNTRNGGYGQGNNVGLRVAKAPVLMIMNPDVRLVESVFSIVLKAFTDDGSLSMYGMKQMKSKDEPNRLSFACTTMMNGYLATILTAFCVRFDIYLPRLMYLNGACFFVRTEVIKGVGYFDESLFMYGEEDDLHWRIGHKYGYHFAYNKHLHYIHLTGDRRPDVGYEMKLVQSSIKQNSKKGYSKTDTLNYYSSTYSIRIWKEKIKSLLGKEDKDMMDVLIECRKRIRKL